MHPDPVCAFYTSHPYPPPVANLDRARDEWRDENRHLAEYHLLWPDTPYRGDLDILVAGCGTWQAAKYALCRPDARVVGIDVSTTSLDHTTQLKRQYNLTNLETRQLPIESADALGQTFDLIVCTGVLHHLVDPDAGLRALRSVLKPEGAMYVDGLRALRPDRGLHAAGLLPEARHRDIRTRDGRSDGCPEGAAPAAPVGGVAARIAGFRKR